MFVRQKSTIVCRAGNLSRLEDPVKENDPDPRWIPFENKRSTVWEHIWRNKEDNSMMCKYCPNKYRSSTSTGSLWKHLSLHHKIPGAKNMGTWSQSSASYTNEKHIAFLNSNIDASDNLSVYCSSFLIYLFKFWTSKVPGLSTPHTPLCVKCTWSSIV